MKISDFLNYTSFPFMRPLPNGGGSYQTPGVNSTDPTIRSLYGDNGMGADNAYPQKPSVAGTKTPVPSNTGNKPPIKTSVAPPPITTPSPSAPAIDKSKFINPANGQLFTPDEYANYMASKMGNGSIPQYAGDAITDPNKSQGDLRNQARDLNNNRNDIATGATDPYGIGSKSGIQYTPAQLGAIEKAYAGVFDPALNDVFERLKTKQEEDKKAEEYRIRAGEKIADNATWKERQIFSTDENIRQSKAINSGDGGGKFNTATNTAETVKKFLEIKGEDNYIDPYIWMASRDAWQSNKGSDASFLSNFKRFLNPASYKLAGIKEPGGSVSPEIQALIDSLE